MSLPCIALGVLGFLTPPIPKQPQRPNVLLILTDDQRADALQVAGHPLLKTPHIDALARQGVRFTNSFVTTPICAASRASILTGSFERRHGYTFDTPPLDAKTCATTFPTLLRNAGYRTGLVGKFGVSVANGQAAKMFDFLAPLSPPFLRTLPSGETRHIDQTATDLALKFLNDRTPGQPFCLSVCYNGPHAEDGNLDNLYPWPQTVDGLYDEVSVPLPNSEEDMTFRREPEFLQKGLNRIRWFWQFDTPEKYVKNVRAYYRMISGIDHEVGRLTTELDRMGLAKDTVIVFTSDNGYFLGERGFSGKWVHYEESLRVPLIVMDPRLSDKQRDKTLNQMALNIDLAPTILSWAGLKVPRTVQGRSLAGLVRGERPRWRRDFFCEHLFDNPDIPKWEGVRGERFVYANYFEQKPPFEFLHDLTRDPKERVNLAGDPGYSGELSVMRRRLAQLRRAATRPSSERDRSSKTTGSIIAPDTADS